MFLLLMCRRYTVLTITVTSHKTAKKLNCDIVCSDISSDPVVVNCKVPAVFGSGNCRANCRCCRAYVIVSFISFTYRFKAKRSEIEAKMSKAK